MKKLVCIIPARGKSKRIKNKNITNFFGKPLIYYSIKIAKESGLFKRIIVTTDSKKIKKIAEFYGAEVPFLRDKKLSDDSTGTDAVIKDCIKKIGTNNVKYHFCIYPTSPLVKKIDLIKAYKKILKLKFDRLISISKFNSPPIRALRIKENSISFINNKAINKRSQDIEDLYHDAGNFYIYNTKTFLRSKNLLKKTTFFKLKKLQSIDINSKEDLNFAKKLFFLQNKLKY